MGRGSVKLVSMRSSATLGKRGVGRGRTYHRLVLGRVEERQWQLDEQERARQRKESHNISESRSCSYQP